jgi:hypothetical protein
MLYWGTRAAKLAWLCTRSDGRGLSSSVLHICFYIFIIDISSPSYCVLITTKGQWSGYIINIDIGTWHIIIETGYTNVLSLIMCSARVVPGISILPPPSPSPPIEPQ